MAPVLVAGLWKALSEEGSYRVSWISQQQKLLTTLLVVSCPVTSSRFDAIIEKNIPLVLSVGALDMVNFGAKHTIPSNFGNRKIHAHNDQAVASFAADGRQDGRQIVTRARSEATNYERVYGEPIPVKELADRVASYVHLCTLYWWLRPFGCGVILGGYDRDGPQLYIVEPSGVLYRYFGTVIGKGRQASKTEIEKLKLSELTCREGVIE